MAQNTNTSNSSTFNFHNVQNKARNLLSSAFTSASALASNLTRIPSSSVKNGELGDAGWTSGFGSGMVGGLLGPAGNGQLNITLSRFRNTAEFIGAFVADDTVNACVRLRSETIAGLNWIIKNKRTGVVVADSKGGVLPDQRNNTQQDNLEPFEKKAAIELHNLLKAPNPYQTWYEFAQTCETYLDLTGNLLIMKDDENGLGWPNYLWPLDPSLVQPIIDPTDGLVGYVYRAGSYMLPLEPDQVIHIKMTNPGSPYFWGIGPIQALAGVLDAQIGIDEYQRAFFANGAVLSGALIAPDSIDPKTFKLMKRELKENFQGVKNHFRVALLTGGVTWQNMSLSQTDMGRKEWKLIGEDRILKAYRVPKSKLGSQDDAQYNKLDAANRAFYQECITPLARLWLARFNLDLCDDYGCELEFEIPLYEDVAAKLDNLNKINTLNYLTLWEKRQNAKQLHPDLVLEDDPDSPLPQITAPQLHTIYANDSVTPLVQLPSPEDEQEEDNPSLLETILKQLEAAKPSNTESSTNATDQTEN